MNIEIAQGARSRARWQRGAFAVLLSGLMALGSGIARADTITETTDFGNTRALAFNLNGHFDAATNASNTNVYGTTDPTTSISGSIGVANDVDFFKFTGLAGQRYYFDVDGGTLSDSILGLFDSNGVMVAQGDDTATPLDPGTTDGLNGFLGVYTLKKNDTFYLSISDYANRPTAYNLSSGTQLTRPIAPGETGSGVATDSGNRDRSDNITVNDNFLGTSTATGTYTLHASIVATPEPATWAMLLMGMGACLVWQRKRRVTA